MKANRKMVRDEKEKNKPTRVRTGDRAGRQTRQRIFFLSQVHVLRDGFRHCAVRGGNARKIQPWHLPELRRVRAVCAVDAD
jgi:hypothetical protein